MSEFSALHGIVSNSVLMNRSYLLNCFRLSGLLQLFICRNVAAYLREYCSSNCGAWRAAYQGGPLTMQGGSLTTVGRLPGQVAYHSGAPTRAGGLPQWGAYQGGSAKQKRSKGKQKAEDRYVGELGQKEHFGIEGGREKGGRGWIWQMITKTYREREMEKSEERIRCGRH